MYMKSFHLLSKEIISFAQQIPKIDNPKEASKEALDGPC
jgi:hypothetical protein